MSMKREWPQQVRYGREPVLANFRPTALERTPDNRHVPWKSARPGMSEAHLALIRKLPCSVCEALSRRDPHHLRSGPAHKERAFGRRSTDKWAVPICRFHHEEVDRAGARGEAAWFDKYAIDPHALAMALWNAKGDLPAMGLILIAHKQQAVRQLRRRAAVNALMRHGLTQAEAEEQYDLGARRLA